MSPEDVKALLSNKPQQLPTKQEEPIDPHGAQGFLEDETWDEDELISLTPEEEAHLNEEVLLQEPLNNANQRTGMSLDQALANWKSQLVLQSWDEFKDIAISAIDNAVNDLIQMGLCGHFVQVRLIEASQKLKSIVAKHG